MKDAFWNDRYDEEGFAYGTAPNIYLTSFKDDFTVGTKILVLGDGEGRNGVWLAEQGCEVVSVDYSKIGVNKSQDLAITKGVKFETICADLVTWGWPKDSFDVVVVIYVHFPPGVREQIHLRVIDALKSGGKLIMECFALDQLDYSSGGPPLFEMLYSAEMMENDFKLLEIQQLEESIIELNEGKYHCGEGAVIRLMATKT